MSSVFLQKIVSGMSEAVVSETLVDRTKYFVSFLGQSKCTLVCVDSSRAIQNVFAARCPEFKVTRSDKCETEGELISCFEDCHIGIMQWHYPIQDCVIGAFILGTNDCLLALKHDTASKCTTYWQQLGCKFVLSDDKTSFVGSFSKTTICNGIRSEPIEVDRLEVNEILASSDAIEYYISHH